VWCGLSPKKELGITSFSVKHELTFDHRGLLSNTDIIFDKYRSVIDCCSLINYRHVLRNVVTAAHE
jgi:hypothetical protein